MNGYQTRSVLHFFLLTFAFSLPLMLLGALIGVQLVPGVPISGLAVLCPVGAATVLCYRKDGRAGVKHLLKRAFDVGRVRNRVWFVPTVLLMPLVMYLSFVRMSVTDIELPVPHATLPEVGGLLVLFFAGALGEELGWTGFATKPLQQRCGAFGGAVIIGIVWAIWHFPGLAEVHRSVTWVAWWTLGTVASRIIIVWLFNNTGQSVFVAAIFHTMINLTWQLFPIDGSYYDPRVTSPLMAVAAFAVVLVWGPKSLARTNRRSVM